MKKVLIILLTLLAVFSFATFADEGQSEDQLTIDGVEEVTEEEAKEVEGEVHCSPTDGIVNVEIIATETTNSESHYKTGEQYGKNKKSDGTSKTTTTKKEKNPDGTVTTTTTTTTSTSETSSDGVVHTETRETSITWKTRW